jgi:NAD+ kinase
MKKVYIVPNDKKDVDLEVTKSTVRCFIDLGMKAILPLKFAGCVFGCAFADHPSGDTDLIVVIGGDGSFIDASVLALELDIPIIGINLGKLGFLSEIDPDNLEALRSLCSGEYKIVEKMLLECELVRNGERRYCTRLAVNDVVVSHAEYLGIADFTVKGNDGGVGYRADGVVVATPAGSTAYSLSVGGPIVSHASDSIIITPIAPHTFFNRSLIFSAKDTVNIENTGVCELNVSVDGRRFEALLPGDVCSVHSSRKRLKVLTFKNNNMLSTLFEKMKMVEEII